MYVYDIIYHTLPQVVLAEMPLLHKALESSLATSYGNIQIVV